MGKLRMLRRLSTLQITAHSGAPHLTSIPMTPSAANESFTAGPVSSFVERLLDRLPQSSFALIGMVLAIKDAAFAVSALLALYVTHELFRAIVLWDGQVRVRRRLELILLSPLVDTLALMASAFLVSLFSPLSRTRATQKLIGGQLAKRQALLVRNARLAEELHADRLRGSDDRLNDIEKELGQLAAEAELLNDREQVGQARVHLQKESVRSGFISQAAVDTARSDLMALQGQRQARARARAALERDRASLRAARREATLQLRSETSEAEASEAAIENCGGFTRNG